MRKEDNTLCFMILAFLWIGLNIADGFWIYFHVHSIVDPVPRTAVNRTSSGWIGYTTMMYIFGLPWGLANLFVSWLVFAGCIAGLEKVDRVFTRLLVIAFITFVVIPVGVAITILPFFGGWIVTPIVQSWTWNHRCDEYPAYAILDAKAYNGPSYVKNVAYFYINGNDDTQFTYEISNPNDDDQWFFRLRQWNVDQSTIPLDFYPTLQSVGYNFADNTLSGNCTVPSTPLVYNGSTTTMSCATGTFHQESKDFFVNVTSTIPLNNTANASATEPTTSFLSTRDTPWYVSNAPPALILREQDRVSGTLSNIVLRTAVVKPHDCTELKVCLAGLHDGREGSLVMAEVLAPLGVLLMRQTDYAVECTTPSDP